MTIQTIHAPDNNAPKHPSQTSNASNNKIRKLLKNKKFWIGVVICTALFILLGGSVGEVIKMILVAAFFLSIYAAIKSQLKLFNIVKNSNKAPSYYQDNHNYFKQHLIDKYDFHVDYESVGILLDTQAKRIAFTIDPKLRPQITLCDFADVQRWQAYHQGVESQNEYGAKQRLLTKHFVSVYIRNPDNPRYDFYADNDVDADQWVARFDALLN